MRVFDAIGPEGEGLPSGGRRRVCPKVEWADTILNRLDHREPANAALVHALKRNWGDAAVTTLGANPSTYCVTRRKTLVPAAAEEKEHPHGHGR